MITKPAIDKAIFHAMKNWDFPVRIQFVCGDILQAEVIVPYSMASNIQSRFFLEKYLKKLPFGGSIERKAELPRKYDIPVGSKIEHK